ncbi:hypothetical protein BDP27DRAFT_53934 [Rhodocollybia butyracea]|uniref:C2H2-type domain-containing protein n=1 Tax=Rhodocollybia butyracea TaxID=206335 RepID=A0A9P5U388_9AGAR|nr:hypothetical protein BDP27DRAFT_53934 [Rhodocollybia butyracea]
MAPPQQNSKVSKVSIVSTCDPQIPIYFKQPYSNNGWRPQMLCLLRDIHSSSACCEAYEISPYKCQHCGDQFSRSDLLSRHVNKCHVNEKASGTTVTTNDTHGRRKGMNAGATRATTSKQACDQCVQSSLPCDGCNPCGNFKSVFFFFLLIDRNLSSKMRSTQGSMYVC